MSILDQRISNSSATEVDSRLRSRSAQERLIGNPGVESTLHIPSLRQDGDDSPSLRIGVFPNPNSAERSWPSAVSRSRCEQLEPLRGAALVSRS